MKKSLTLVLLSLIAVLVLIFGALPFYLGIKAEETLNEQYKLLSENSFIEVTEHTYNRSWFSAEEKTTIRLKPQFIQPYTQSLPENLSTIATSSITLVNKVKHGPFADGKFARAVVNTQIEYSDDVDKNLKRFFGDQKPLSINNTLNLFGGGTVDITMPSFDYEELSGIKIVWQGLNSQIDYKGNFDAYKILAESPDLKITLADKGEVSYGKLKYTSWTEQSDSNLSVGNSQFNLGSFKIQWNESLDYNIRLNELINMITDLQIGAFINPTGSLEANSVMLSGVEFTTSMEEKDKFINAKGALKFAELKMGKEQYGPLDLSITAEHLDAPSLFALRSKITEIGSKGLSNEELQDQIVEAARNEGLPLFTNNPKFKINQFNLTLPEGDFKASGYLAFNQLTKDDLENFSQMIAKTEAEFDISSPQRIIEILAENQASKLFSIDPEMENAPTVDEIKETARMMVNATIQGMANEGFVNIKNGQVNSVLKLKDNQFFMNNKSLTDGDNRENDIDHLTEDLYASEASAN